MEKLWKQRDWREIDIFIEFVEQMEDEIEEKEWNKEKDRWEKGRRNKNNRKDDDDKVKRGGNE